MDKSDTKFSLEKTKSKSKKYIRNMKFERFADIMMVDEFFISKATYRIYQNLEKLNSTKFYGAN